MGYAPNSKRACYFYDEEFGNFHYGHGHPMKPHRVRMTHDLIHEYGLTNRLDRMYPTIPSEDVLTRFHSDEYVHFLKTVTTDNQADFGDSMQRFNVGDDCPVFDGLWEFCGLYTGGSVGGAHQLLTGKYDIALNWAGGLHHGKKHEASGFCYVNDCVLAGLEFLKYRHRVLYLDIDVHHGDGVEEAFYTSPRLMTCSFHKYGDFFPGTGSVDDIGLGEGKGYSVNVPLQNGCDDTTFKYIFDFVMDMVLAEYQPEAIMLQSGADSLAGDRLGCFNLSLDGHSYAVRKLRSKGIPLLIVGGGGYSLRNVAKCWANETAAALGTALDPYIPSKSRYYSYYAPDHTLAVRASNMKDLNERKRVDRTLQTVAENFRQYVSPVGAQLSTSGAEPLGDIYQTKQEEDLDPDVRPEDPCTDDAHFEQVPQDEVVF